jgi:hypothetical protein
VQTSPFVKQHGPPWTREQGAALSRGTLAGTEGAKKKMIQMNCLNVSTHVCKISLLSRGF